MVEVNKVEVGFDADVKSFNRGVNSMERKLEEFERKADKETEKVSKRFDLMNGSVKKVEKTMNGFDENSDLSKLNGHLKKVQNEFENTGKVSEDSFRKLDNSIKMVDFSKLDESSKKSMTAVQNDVGKLRKSLTSLSSIKYADGMSDQSKLVALEFSKMQRAVNSNSLSLRQLKNNMNPSDFEAYKKSIGTVRNTMHTFSKELETTGNVSSSTFHKLNNDVKSVNFKSLPTSAARAFGQVKKQTVLLGGDFNRMGDSLTRNNVRFNAFKNNFIAGTRNIGNKFEETMTVFNRWGTRFRNIQEVGEHVFGGVLIPLIGSLIPVAGTATTAIMGIGAGLGSVAGGAVGLGGAFGISLIAIKAFAGQATSALQMLEDGQLKVTGEVKRYQSSLKGLQNDWKSLINQNQAQIFNTMSNGINMARYSLSTLNPFLVKTAAQIEKASSKMHDWVTSSKNATAAFAMLNKIGPPIFQNILNSAGHVGNGITRIFTAFGPLFTWTGQGLEKLSKKFDVWANSSNTQRGIASFINYTKANLPILGSIFGNTFLGIIELFKAFSGQTTWALKGLDSLTQRFKNWAATLDQTQGFKDFIKYTRDNAPVAGQMVGNLVTVLVEVIKALAPISAIILRVVTSFLGWLGAMMKTHPMLAKMVAGLLLFAGAIKSALFISSLIAVFGNLRKALVLLIGTQKAAAIASGIFTSASIKQNGILKTLQLAYMGLIGRIKAFSLSQKMAALQTKLLSMYIAIQNGLIRIKNALWLTARKRLMAFILAQSLNIKSMKMAIVTSKAWAIATKAAALATRGLGLAIRFMTGPIGIVITVVGLLVAAFIHLWKTNSSFRNGVIGIWNSIKQAAINIFGWLKPYLQAIWNGIKTGALWTWNALKIAAIAIWNAIKYAVTNPMGALKAALSAIWNGIKFAAVWAWNAIKTAVMFIINAWLSQVRANFNTLKSFFSAIWNGIKTAAIWSWNMIKNGVMLVIRGWIFAIRTAFAGIKTFFSAIWNGIKASAIWTWNAIKNGVMIIIRAWITSMRATVSGLRAFFTAVWNGIKTVSLYVWGAIKNGVVAAIRGLSTGVRAIISTLRTWIVTTWNYIKSKVVGAARLIWTGVRTAFNYLSSAVRKIISALRTWLVKAWTYIKNRVIALARLIWTNVRKAFTGLWNSTKKIFTTLKNWVVKTWTYIKNKVIALARSLWTNVRKAFTYLWNSTKKIFSTLRSWLVKAWTYIRNKVVALARSLWNGVKKIFNALWNFTRNIFNKLKNWLINVWKTIRNKVVSWAHSLWSGVKKTWNNLWNGTKSIITKVKNWLVNTWKGIKNSVVGTVKSLWGKVKDTFNNMNNGLKTIIGKIKGHINGMVKSVKEGLNKLIKGVNWVGDKLGMGKQMIKPMKLSTGTSPNPNRYVSNGKINQDTIAVVGDKGRGNGRGGFRNETITYPNGKKVITPNTDTMAYLPKGSTVESGAQTQANYPAFAKGTLNNLKNGAVNMLGKAHKKGEEVTGDVVSGGKAVAGKAYNKGKAAVSAGAEKVKGWAGTAAKTASKWIGDIEDWFEKPGKLVNKVFKAFGVGPGNLPGEMPAKMMKGAYGKLKKGAVDTIKGWFDEQGGEGGWVDISKGVNFPFSPSGHAPGYPFAGPHMGVDLNYKYDKLYSTHSGTATARSGWNGGFGNSMWIDAANATRIIYGHMSKLAFNGSKKVHPGSYLGVSGNTGKSSGPHLHYEMQKNGKPINPMPFLKKQSKGGSKSGKKWAGTIKRALAMNGLPTTSAYVNAWAKQIDSESGGNPRAVQGGYVDANTGGNEAKGLVQVAKSTFNSMKFKGHGNVFNPLDNLLAGIHWAKYKYGKDMLGVIGHGHGYADGGILNTPELAWLAEGGFSESIISHDPANKVKSKAIHDRTGEMLGFNEDVEIMRIMADLLRENNAYQSDIAENTERAANKSSVIEMNSKKVAQEVAGDVNKEIKKQEQRKLRMKGKI
ncbi:peptidoglycan DD-metalloendopeptidase family protein [Staphylococcus saprophyticus]|nr:peptidoglycan DD-metalloendopeptidase family protein [Staphylococcus saprophyticus]